MFQSFCVELIPRATGNVHWNMQIVMFEKECLIVELLFVCKAHTVQRLFVNKQKVIVSIIIHIITVLFVVHWQG
jgi:hypothetical protein